MTKLFNIIFFPFLKTSWILIFCEIAILSIISGIVYQSGPTTLIIFFGLLALILNRLASFLISIAFALIFFNYLFSFVGYMAGMPMEEVILIINASIFKQIASAILVLIIFYKHLKSSILLRRKVIQITDFVFNRIGYFGISSTKEPNNMNISFEGQSLKNKKVIAYTYKILNHFVPNNDKNINIKIMEVHHIPNRDLLGGEALGNRSIAGTAQRHGNNIIIKIANYAPDQVDFEEKMQTLAHELVHAKQYILGQLLNGKWKGQPISNYFHLPYRNYPWEEEAYGLEESLYKKFWE